MRYDFDKVIERKGTHSLKWDATEKYLKAKDVLPLWVADMDFPSPPAVMEALKNRLEYPIFGYPEPPESIIESIISWHKSRHQWNITKESIKYIPGVVPGLNYAIRTFSKAGDGIIIQPPVYRPFFECIKNNDRKIIENELIFNNDKYEINFDELEDLVKDATMMILCNPHNPVGRVWEKDELQRLLKLCAENNIILVVDEIHEDFTFSGHTHIPVLNADPSAPKIAISLISPAKTFNLQPFQMAAAIIPDEILRERYEHELQKQGIHLMNEMGMIAMQAAYNHGADWLNELLVYLEDNRNYILEYFAENIPQIKPITPEGTYLCWLDCRNLGWSQKELVEFFNEKAKVGLVNGMFFGKAGTGFMRMNFGCPRKTLDKALELIFTAIKAL